MKAKSNINRFLAVMMLISVLFILFSIYENTEVHADDKGNDWYELFTDTEEEENWAFPGDSLTVCATASHFYYDEYGHLQIEENPSGITYEWTISENADLARITPYSSDPSKALVTMNPVPQGEDGVWDNVLIKVTIKDKSGNILAESEQNTSVSSDNYTLFQLSNNMRLEPGSSEDLIMEIRHRSMELRDKGIDYELEDIVSYKWKFDDSKIEIRDADGNLVRSDEEIPNQSKSIRFSVKRLTEEDYDFSFEAYDEDRTPFTRWFRYIPDYSEEPSEPETIIKAANTMSAAAVKSGAAVKYARLKKKAQYISAKKAFVVKDPVGKVTYKLTKKDSKAKNKIKVSSAGKITVAKGLKKGTYNIKVKVTAAGNSYYKSKSKTVTLKIVVK